jgi:PTH1 family peptidyl-tRNA hydrolase
MIAIIGLGNIGEGYANTYHNMGFMVLDAYAKRHGLTFSKNKFNGTIAEGMINGEKAILLKPSTFMNLSGDSVYKLVSMLKIDLKNIIVVYDDIDLPVGALRIRANGSAGTHNGMRNIVTRLSTSEFARLRVGIGRDERLNLADYVLSRVSKQNMEILEPSFIKACDALDDFIKNKCDATKVIINK